MAYVIIPNTDVDAESPITESLMTQLRDNPIAIANANAGTDEPPRVLCNASGATGIASTDGTEGQVLQVVNEVNPGTGQSGLMVRPVTSVGQAVVRSSSNAQQLSGGVSASVDLPLDTTGIWSVTVNSSGHGTIDSGSAAGVLEASSSRSGGVIFSSGAVTTNTTSVINVGRNASLTLTVSVPSSGVLRLAASYDDNRTNNYKGVLISGVAVRL